MRCRNKKYLCLLGFLSLFMVAFSIPIHVDSSPYYVTHPTFFPSKSGSYISFDSGLLPLSFNTLYRDSSTRWHFNDTWVRSTIDMSVTAFFVDNWFNYTVSGVGTQEINNGSKPTNVYFNGEERSEGHGWSYSGGTVTVSTTGTDISLYWGLVASTSNGVNILIYEGSGLGFQSGSKYVLLSPTTGDLNSSDYFLSLYEDGGSFRFYSNESLTLQVTFDVTNLRIEGDKGNEKRYINSGDSVDIDLGDTVLIIWVIHVEAWLPLMFILGIFGIVSMIGGSMYGVKELKKHNYEHGLVTSIIFIAVGFCFILAWLWG